MWTVVVARVLRPAEQALQVLSIRLMILLQLEAEDEGESEVREAEAEAFCLGVLGFQVEAAEEWVVLGSAEHG